MTEPARTGPAAPVRVAVLGGGCGGLAAAWALSATPELRERFDVTVHVVVAPRDTTRPVYPYPLVPKYNGSGPANDASSFHPVVSPHAHDYSRWIGNNLFHQPVNASQGSRAQPRRRSSPAAAGS